MAVNDFIKNAEKRLAKKAEIKEEDIEDAFVKYAKNNKCKALKLIFLSKKGFPDRSVLCPGGRIFFIEFKRKNKKPTKLQEKVRDTIIKPLGFKYFVCDKIGQAEKHLEQFLWDE